MSGATVGLGVRRGKGLALLMVLLAVAVAAVLAVRVAAAEEPRVEGSSGWALGGAAWYSAGSAVSGHGPLVVYPGLGVPVALGNVSYAEKGGGLVAVASAPAPRLGCGVSGEPAMLEVLREEIRGELGFLEELLDALKTGRRLGYRLMERSELAATVPKWVRRLDAELGRSSWMETAAEAVAVAQYATVEGEGPDPARALAELQELLGREAAAPGGSRGLRRGAVVGSEWPLPWTGVSWRALPRGLFWLGGPGWPPGALAYVRGQWSEAVVGVWLDEVNMTQDPETNQLPVYSLSAGLSDFDGDGRLDYLVAFGGASPWDRHRRSLRDMSIGVYLFVDEGAGGHGFYVVAGDPGYARKLYGGSLRWLLEGPGELRCPDAVAPVARDRAFLAVVGERGGGYNTSIYYLEGGRLYFVATLPGRSDYLAALLCSGGRCLLLDYAGWRLLLYDAAGHKLLGVERLPVEGFPREGGRFDLRRVAAYPVDLDGDGVPEVVATVAVYDDESGAWLPVLTVVASASWRAPAPLDRDGDGYVDAVAYPDGGVSEAPMPRAACGKELYDEYNRLYRAFVRAVTGIAAEAMNARRVDVLAALASRANLTLYSYSGYLYYRVLTANAYPGEAIARDLARAGVGAAYAASLINAMGALAQAPLRLRWDRATMGVHLLAYDVGLDAAKLRLLLEEKGQRAVHLLGLGRDPALADLLKAYVDDIEDVLAWMRKHGKMPQQTTRVSPTATTAQAGGGTETTAAQPAGAGGASTTATTAETATSGAGVGGVSPTTPQPATAAATQRASQQQTRKGPAAGSTGLAAAVLALVLVAALALAARRRSG